MPFTLFLSHSLSLSLFLIHTQNGAAPTAKMQGGQVRLRDPYED